MGILYGEEIHGRHAEGPRSLGERLDQATGVYDPSSFQISGSCFGTTLSELLRRQQRPHWYRSHGLSPRCERGRTHNDNTNDSYHLVMSKSISNAIHDKQ